MTSLLDRVYTVLANREHYFQDGWGEREAFPYLLKANPREFHRREVPDISLRWGPGRIQEDVTIREGWFDSPYRFVWKDGRKTITNVLPDEANRALVQMILPRPWKADMPLAIHFAATGDEGFNRRRVSMAMPLARRGIGSVILENPFYGERRPSWQKGSLIREFSEFMRMSRAAMDEGIALARKLREEGYGPLGFTGISMGGYIALAAAGRAGFPMAVGACIPTHCASAVYLDGALRRACAWEKLNESMPNGATFKGLSAPEDAPELMRSIMSLGDIRHFPMPKRPDAVVILGAKHDHYIPRYSTEIIHEHLTGSVLRWLDTGHVGTFVFHRNECNETVIEAFDRL